MTQLTTSGDAPIETFADLPLQPTGSGVADLEIAYEQMKLADDANEAAVVDGGATIPDPAAIAESEAHPS